MTASIPAALKRTLRATFGIARLHEGQHEVIARVLAGEDTLVIMPTGSGKSLCYQLPAMHLKGTTVVVSPLIALMKDQADKLERAGVSAAQLNSALSKQVRAESMERIADASADIIFSTPEGLSDPTFMAALKKQRVALLVVDEAHCVSHWGHDFRPAFLGIGAVLHELGDPPLLALTATATDSVIDDIRVQLGRPRMRVISTGIYRSNLRLRVMQAVNEEEKFDLLLRCLDDTKGCGILYCSTVKACEELHDRLTAAGQSVTRYHGRLSAAERHANQDLFMNGEARVMVATNAFGMGIDKADVRFVVHYQMPGNLESYYQEAGRAGRDGEPADCVLIFHRKDRQVQQFFLARRYPSADDLMNVHTALTRASRPMTLPEIDEAMPSLARRRIAVALKLLRDGGMVETNAEQTWTPVLTKPATHKTLATLATAYDEKAQRDADSLERIVMYAQTGFCRWGVLIDAFDETAPFEGGCGCCDNCLRPAPEPAAIEEAPPQRCASPEPTLHLGDAVRVKRFGEGRVEQVSAEAISVVFPDGSKRSFMASFVEAVPEVADAAMTPGLPDATELPDVPVVAGVAGVPTAAAIQAAA